MKKLLSAVLSFAMIFTMFTIASPKAAAAVGNAAKIGTKEYATLNEAIAHVSDGETITLLRDVTDATGIAVESGKNFTLDFGGHVYTLSGPGAGSPTTETNGFQLLKDSTITFQNGTVNIAPDANNIKRIIQNYADLTLENMRFETMNQVGGEDYALSFNNGTIVFKGTTSIVTSSRDVIAFDICKFSSYPSARVIFDESYTGAIGGKIVYDSPNADTHSLTIAGNGTFASIETTAASAADPAIEIESGTFEDLSALPYLSAGADVTVSLAEDVTEDAVIPADTTVTLDLNGHTITNQADHTIHNYGNLTIEGEGTIDNVSHGRAAVYNELGASALLKGGTYTRSQENGSNSSISGGNSYYNIVNHGDMTIEEGVVVRQDGKFSSLIENGWYNGNQNTTKKPSNMVIHGGTFTGGLNTIKNDDYGKLTINGGTFTNVAQAAVLNWNETTINNGTFVSDQAVILNGKLDDEMDKGKLIINGGSFTAGGDHEVIEPMSGGNANSLTDIRISGGTFSGDVSAYVEAGNKLVETEDGFIVVPNTEGVTLDASEQTLKVGESTTLHATLTPEGAVEELVWTSSDPTIVTVDANGTITAVKEGSATITVTAGAYRAQCEVTVIADEKEPQEPTTPPTDDKDPGTSNGEKEPGTDNEGPATSAVAMGGMFASMAVLSGGIVVVLREKRRRNS